MKKALLFGFALAFASPLQATAKAPPIALVALTPTVSTNFSGGDEVHQLLTSTTGMILIGTVETSTSPLVSSPSLGGSDGFIAALNSQGVKLWELRLGTPGDDVATAGYVDASGTIWVAGSSAMSPSNSTPAPGLNRLTIWQISSAGVLENTFSKDLVEIDIPRSIALKGENFIIQGDSNKAGLPGFAVSLTQVGKIGSVKNNAYYHVTSPQIFNSLSAAYGWQSYVTSKPIKGVTGLPLRKATAILIKSSLKDRTLKGVYSIVGSPLSLQYQNGLGIVVLSQGSGTYFLTVIHTK